DVVGTSVKPEVAVILDWENGWAIREGAKVFLGDNCKYREECAAHYAPFWQMGVPVDMIDQTGSLDAYKFVVLPMSYMLRPGFAEKLKQYVADGGTAVMTYWSAVVDESDLCYLGGIPGDGLREVFGIWEEETQSYYPHESVGIDALKGNGAGLSGAYKAVDTCSVIHPEGAEVLATFTEEYFAGSPAVTVNTYGKGKAYYLAARTRDTLLDDLYGKLVADLAIKRAIDIELPAGVTAQLRTDGTTRYVFLSNFTDAAVCVQLDQGYYDMLTETTVDGALALAPYGVCVLQCAPAN
ncbi:MAG: beta-galactosidase trimerization domain-containing protein, partial [Kiritimatiellia bacterium]